MPYNFIYGIIAKKMLRRGCQGYLIVVRDTKVDKRVVENMPIMFEFPDVFPKELPGLPPERKIEFYIDVVSNIYSISLPLYRMTPIKLKELKEQLQELFDRGFIKPSTSS